MYVHYVHSPPFYPATIILNATFSFVKHSAQLLTRSPCCSPVRGSPGPALCQSVLSPRLSSEWFPHLTRLQSPVSTLVRRTPSLDENPPPGPSPHRAHPPTTVVTQSATHTAPFRLFCEAPPVSQWSPDGPTHTVYPGYLVSFFSLVPLLC